MTAPILFLDIDGVLNTGRGAFLAQNRRLAEERRQGASQYDILPRIAFDPVAVALLNYLVERADAQIVVHSSWASYFRDRLPEVLAAQAVDTSYLYESWFADAPPSFGRDARIEGWFGDRGRDTDRPPHAILDDSVFRGDALIAHHVHIDRHIGLTTGDARVALALLGVEDDRYAGLIPVADDDWRRVRDAHDTGEPGDHVRALRWLHDDRPGDTTRAERLANEPEDDPLAVFGLSPGMSRAERRELVFRDLPEKAGRA